MRILTTGQLGDILAASEITSTSTHAGMLIHEINHPELGSVITIQGADGDGLLITK